jgi:hypothetical protein
VMLLRTWSGSVVDTDERGWGVAWLVALGWMRWWCFRLRCGGCPTCAGLTGRGRKHCAVCGWL